MARDFNTPRRYYGALLKLKLQTLRCANPDCKAEFTQTALNQWFCSDPCRLAERPWQPKIKAVFDEFDAFINRHGITRHAVIHTDLWNELTKPGKNNHRINKSNEKLRSRVATKLKMIMDRFRRGFYILADDGVHFQNPPWLPYCPIDHTYCRGAILPGDCPRRHPECAYTKNEWRLIYEHRGVYAFDMDKNRTRGLNRRKGTSLIGWRVAKKSDKPDDAPIREHAPTKPDPPGKTPRNDHGV